jgi:hypothetical protein
MAGKVEGFSGSAVCFPKAFGWPQQLGLVLLCGAVALQLRAKADGKPG